MKLGSSEDKGFSSGDQHAKKDAYTFFLISDLPYGAFNTLPAPERK